MRASARLNSGRRPPPYAREFTSAKRAGAPVNPWLFAGPGAWRRAACRGPGRLVLPEGAQPEQFDWRCVSREIVVVHWPRALLHEVDALGALLVRAGAPAVLVLEDRSAPGCIARAFRRYVRGAR